ATLVAGAVASAADASLLANIPRPLVLLVGWDGADHRRVEQLLRAGRLPSLATVVAAGSFSELRIVDGDNTATMCSWTTILTGLPDMIHGTRTNEDYRAAPQGSTIFERLGARGLPSVYVAGKCRKKKADGTPGNSGGMCTGTDDEGRPYPLLHVRGLHPWPLVHHVTNSALAMERVTDECLEGLARAEWRGFAFCHYQWPDRTGHVRGGSSAEYDADVVALDAELGRLWRAVPLDAAILVASDHGFECAGRADEPRSEYVDRIRGTRVEWCFTHAWQPRAILASSVPLLPHATGRDVFSTVTDLLGAGASGSPGARSLLP
ncbi:MAG: alkaline phosphatase family protein, partial [Candidatus Binatia bacterium]